MLIITSIFTLKFINVNISGAICHKIISNGSIHMLLDTRNPFVMWPRWSKVKVTQKVKGQWQNLCIFSLINQINVIFWWNSWFIIFHYFNMNICFENKIKWVRISALICIKTLLQERIWKRKHKWSFWRNAGKRW